MDPRPDCIARVDGAGQLAVVAAAEAAGVERVVFVSFPPASPDHPFQRAKRAVEERLRSAQLEHVILHPQKFMDVWFTKPLGFDPDGSVTLYGGGDAAQAWVAVADVAAVAVQAVRDPRLANQTIPFGGPAAHTQREVVALYEQLLGRAIATEVMPRSAARVDARRRVVADRGVARRRAARGDGAERPGMARLRRDPSTSHARRSQISRLPTPTRRAVDDPSLRYLHGVPE